VWGGGGVGVVFEGGHVRIGVWVCLERDRGVVDSGGGGGGGGCRGVGGGVGRGSGGGRGMGGWEGMLFGVSTTSKRNGVPSLLSLFRVWGEGEVGVVCV